MKKKIYMSNRLAQIKIGSLIVASLLFAASCGSGESSSTSEELLGEQLAETQEQIKELQQTIQDLQQNTENQPVQIEESQDEIAQEELTENSDEQVEDSQEEEGFPADGVPDEASPPCPPQDPMPDSEAIPMASIVLDMDGDGNIESGQTYYNWDLEVFYAHVSGSEFGPYWVELDDIGTAPPNQWKASFGTDINEDSRSEFWVRQIPFGPSTVGYRVLIFEDCELKIAYIPDSNELFIDGGTVGTSWRIACELEDGVPVIVQYEIISGEVEADSSLTGMVYQLSSTGFTFITVRNLETFEDPGGPYGNECESWMQDPPPWIDS